MAWIQAAVVVSAFLAGGGSANEGPYDFREKVLANGLRVVTLEDRSCPIVAVQIWYHVGSKDEDPERQGFAHLFEHMMFRGTDRLGPTDHFDLIRKTGGSSNGFTTFDNTTYINVVPSNQLELALWLEAERMAALKIDEAGFETERRVVEEERRLGLNRPYGSVPEKLLAKVFPGHPYSWSPIGNIPHLRAATIDELQRFWDRYYVPGNATLVMVGAIRHGEAQELAGKHFGWIPKCPEPPRAPPPPAAADSPRDFTIQEPRGPVPVTGVGYRVVPMGHPDTAALRVLSTILGEGDSSRLHRELVKKNVAAVAMSALMQMEQAGYLAAGAAVMPFGDTGRALAALDEEIGKIRDGGVSKTELTRARNTILKGLVEERLNVESKAHVLGQAATLLGDVDEANRDFQRYREITVEEVARVAREYLVPERRTVVTVKPTLLGMIRSLLGGKGPPEDEGAEAAKPETAETRRATPGGPRADVVRPPALPESPPLAPLLETLPSIERAERRLRNGLKVVVVPNDEVPHVTATLGLMHGASSEDPERPGAASMACGMLTRGTRRHSADQLARELETRAIEITGSADADTARIEASAVSDQFEDLMRFLAEVVREPTFPAEELETLKRTTLTGLLVQEREAANQASRQFQRVIYGEHPYSRPPTGTAADVRKLAVSDLREWWRDFARPGLAVLYIAGDVRAAEAFRIAEMHFGSWETTGEAPRRIRKPFPGSGKMQIHLIDRPGSYQSQIRVGRLGQILRTSADHATATVLNQVFGGSFGSRLNATLRVKKGLTYGIRGGFSSRREGGELTISTFSKTPKTAEAVKTILEEVDRLLTEKPTAVELEQAKSYLVGSFARGRETPQSVVNDLWLVESEGLPVDHFESFLKKVRDVTADDVIRVARNHVRPRRLAIVVVGEAARIREDLEKIAPVILVDGK